MIVALSCRSTHGAAGAGLAHTTTCSNLPLIPKLVKESDKIAQAVPWVRQHYRTRAVETIWQRRWVRHAAPASGR